MSLTEWDRCDDVVAIAKKATAHNYGEVVYEVVRGVDGCDMRLSSWPRCQEAKRALEAAGYWVEEDYRPFANWLMVRPA